MIALGNVFRRDDGVGPAVAEAVAAMALPGVRVVCAAETTAILDAWDGADLAVVVDAATGGEPGRVRRCGLDELTEQTPVSSHDLGLRQTYALARALDRAPGRVIVVTVDAADTGHGSGLSPAVTAALPAALQVVRGCLGVPGLVGEPAEEPGHQQT